MSQTKLESLLRDFPFARNASVECLEVGLPRSPDTKVTYSFGLGGNTYEGTFDQLEKAIRLPALSLSELQLHLQEHRVSR
jgi:hypothetical protein